MGYQVRQLCYIHVYYYMCIHKRLSDEQVRQLLQQINIMLGVPWCLNFAIFTFEKPFFTLKLHILLSSHLLTIHLHFFSLHSFDFHDSSFLQTYKPRSSFFEKDRYPLPHAHSPTKLDASHISFRLSNVWIITDNVWHQGFINKNIIWCLGLVIDLNMIITGVVVIS